MEKLEQAVVRRVYLPTETLGSWFFRDMNNFLVKTMELPRLDGGNHPNVNCFPEGIYEVIKELYTEKHPYPHFRVLNVPGRKGILVHKITYVKDLLGCIGVGLSFEDWNNDKVPDMKQSTDGLELLIKTMPDRFMLKVEEKAK